MLRKPEKLCSELTNKHTNDAMNIKTYKSFWLSQVPEFHGTVEVDRHEGLRLGACTVDGYAAR